MHISCAAMRREPAVTFRNYLFTIKGPVIANPVAGEMLRWADDFQSECKYG